MSRSEVYTALKRTVHFSCPAVCTIESMFDPEKFQRPLAFEFLQSLANCRTARRADALFACHPLLRATTAGTR